jgi:hypothetical protein
MSPPPKGEAASLVLMDAARATLAVGSAAELSGRAFEIFARMPKGNGVLLVAAGAVLAFATAAALIEYLAPMTGDRNAGLPEPLRANSARARANIGARDQGTARRLDPDEWSVHHLIGVHAAQRHTTLLTDAARAGWRMDEAENLMALPRTVAAQTKLASQGIHLPLLDNGHPEWNDTVDEELQLIREKLAGSGLARDSKEYAALARDLLGQLQTSLRRKAVLMKRIVWNENNPDHSQNTT